MRWGPQAGRGWCWGRPSPPPRRGASCRVSSAGPSPPDASRGRSARPFGRPLDPPGARFVPPHRNLSRFRSPTAEAARSSPVGAGDSSAGAYGRASRGSPATHPQVLLWNLRDTDDPPAGASATPTTLPRESPRNGQGEPSAGPRDLPTSPPLESPRHRRPSRGSLRHTTTLPRESPRNGQGKPSAGAPRRTHKSSAGISATPTTLPREPPPHDDSSAGVPAGRSGQTLREPRREVQVDGDGTGGNCRPHSGSEPPNRAPGRSRGRPKAERSDPLRAQAPRDQQN
jgi:hypothetical protein